MKSGQCAAEVRLKLYISKVFTRLACLSGEDNFGLSKNHSTPLDSGRNRKTIQQTGIVLAFFGKIIFNELTKDIEEECIVRLSVIAVSER